MDELIEYLRGVAENANLPQYMRDRLTEAAAALEAAREDAWQPIETAPKDGELILVCRLGETSTWPAWWRQRETFNLRDRNGWHSKENTPLKFNPTHWRPLPAPLSAPPAIDQARGKGVQDEA